MDSRAKDPNDRRSIMLQQIYEKAAIFLLFPKIVGLLKNVQNETLTKQSDNVLIRECRVRIAVPSNLDQVCEEFGRCKKFGYKEYFKDMDHYASAPKPSEETAHINEGSSHALNLMAGPVIQESVADFHQITNHKDFA